MPFFCSATRFRAAMHIADQQERGGCEPRVGGHIKVSFMPDCAMLCRVMATWQAGLGQYQWRLQADHAG